jgi:hypothetical protein
MRGPRQACKSWHTQTDLRAHLRCAATSREQLDVCAIFSSLAPAALATARSALSAPRTCGQNPAKSC